MFLATAKVYRLLLAAGSRGFVGLMVVGTPELARLLVPALAYASWGSLVPTHVVEEHPTRRFIVSSIDPVCAFHGKRRSEHICLYCCLCFDPLTPEQCSINAEGEREDVCVPCAKFEAKQLAAREAQS